jgi:RNA binding exosome subunit
MSQNLLTSIELSFLIHATEDLDKVLDVVRSLVPKDYANKMKIQRDELKDHYGNPIILVKIRIKEARAIQYIINGLSDGLNNKEKRSLFSGIEKRLDEKGTLYLRLDKQAACLGVLRLSEEDYIRIKITPKTHNSYINDVIDVYRKIGLIL